jgi:hypothetical protein
MGNVGNVMNVENVENVENVRMDMGLFYLHSKFLQRPTER